MTASARWSRFWRKSQFNAARKVAGDAVPVLLVLVCANVQSIGPETSRVGTGDSESPYSCDTVTQLIPEGNHMNSIIYLVGLVVIVLFVLSFLGLR